MLSNQLQGSRNDWQTPPLLRTHILNEWPVDVDAAALSTNKLVPKYFGPDHTSPHLQDALSLDWNLYGKTFFFNPPYSTYVPREKDGKRVKVSVIKQWVDKAVEVVKTGGPETKVIGLLSASMSEGWWAGCDYAEEVRLLVPRVGFVVPERGTVTSPPFGAALVIWTSNHAQNVLRPLTMYQRWDWKKWEFPHSA